MKLVYFVHSTTLDNERGLATGWSDSPLSEKGMEQANQLSIDIAKSHFDVVFCSDLGRAIDTARITFPCRDIRADWRLREIDYGLLNKKTSKEVKNNLAERVDSPFPQGESYADVALRVASFLKDLTDLFDDTCIVAAVSHQAPQLALDVLLHGKTWEGAFHDDWRNRGAWQPGWVHELSHR